MSRLKPYIFIPAWMKMLSFIDSGGSPNHYIKCAKSNRISDVHARKIVKELETKGYISRKKGVYILTIKGHWTVSPIRDIIKMTK